ncbi:hypothetical protein N2152v2_002219 [Parachlorella kessleri]
MGFANAAPLTPPVPAALSGISVAQSPALLAPAERQEVAELEQLLLAPGGGSQPLRSPTGHEHRTSPKKQPREPVHHSADYGCSAEGTAVVDVDPSSLSSNTAAEVALVKEVDSKQQQQQALHEKTRQQGQQQPVAQPTRKQRRSNSRKAARQQQQKPEVPNGAAAAAERAHKQPVGRGLNNGYQQELQATVKGWLGPRLEDMGFEERSFPQLQPLSRPANNGSSPSGICSGDARSAAVTESCLAPDAAAVWDLQEGGRLLHESHAAHSYMSTADEHAQVMIGLYEQFAREAAGLPVIAGRKSLSSTMPGSASSYTLQALVPNSQAVMAMEVASSDFLADNYSRALDASYPSSGGSQEHFSQMGSALHSAVLGAAVIAHGDDSGMVLPPSLAPVQVVVTAVRKHHCNQSALDSEVERICSTLLAAGLRAEIDGRRCQPARRFADSERRGVPLRIECSLARQLSCVRLVLVLEASNVAGKAVRPADVKARTCTIAQRSIPGAVGKLTGISSEPGSLASTVAGLLDEQQSSMQYRAAISLETNIVDVTSFYELQAVIEAGKWARGPWAGSVEDEAAVMEETGASLSLVTVSEGHSRLCSLANQHCPDLSG